MLERDRERRERERATKERAGQLGEIREACATLPGFIREAWHVLEPSQPFKWGWSLDAIADHLMAVSTGDILRLLMNVPPGFMKSLMTGVFWPAFEWGPMARPALRILGASFKQEHAERDTDRMRTLVTSDWYRELWPHVQVKGKGSSDNFANTATGWRKGSPITELTGDRGDRVVIDDPHSVEGGESELRRAKALRVLRETVPTRLNSPEKSAIIVIMQRVHEDDSAGMIIRENLGYTHLMLPMRFEPSRRCTTYLGHGRSFTDPRVYEGELLFPERFPPEAVDRTENEMTPYAVAGQMQQKPVPREGLLFDPTWFEIVDHIPAGGKEARAWDLAATEKKTQKADPDWTVGLKGKRAGDGCFYITAMWRDRQGPGVVANAIKNSASQDGHGCHVRLPQDPGQAGKTQAAFHMRMLAGYPLTIEPVSGDKIQRAGPAAVQAKNGLIKLARGPWNKAFLDEVGTFPMAKHDDIVDALADLINVLSLVATYSLEGVY